MKTILIINPISGNKNFDKVKKIVTDKLSLHQQEFELFVTTMDNTATDIASRAIQQGIELIIVVGGDGTIREVINAIVGSNIILGIVPNGTGNLLATSLGIPSDIEKAMDIVFEGKKQKMDVGKINDHYFAIIAGCGFDAEIMKNINKNHKKLLGLAAYFIEGLKQYLSPKRAVFKIDIDGKKYKFKAINVLFVNSSNILGNFISIVPESSIYDGYLDVCIVSPKTFFDFIPVLWKIFMRQNTHILDKNTKIITFKAKRIEFLCRPKLMIQADGDVIGYPPGLVEVFPGALNVIVPEKIDTFLMNPDNFFKSLLGKTLGKSF